MRIPRCGKPVRGNVHNEAGSLLTLCWREMDSNVRFLVGKRQTVMGDGTAVSKTGTDLLGNQRFESTSLQRRIVCEPYFSIRARVGYKLTTASRAASMRPGLPFRAGRLVAA